MDFQFKKDPQSYYRPLLDWNFSVMFSIRIRKVCTWFHGKSKFQTLYKTLQALWWKLINFVISAHVVWACKKKKKKKKSRRQFEWMNNFFVKLHFLQARCRNYWIFLSLIFYVKSKLVILESKNLPFEQNFVKSLFS